MNWDKINAVLRCIIHIQLIVLALVIQSGFLVVYSVFRLMYEIGKLIDTFKNH